MEICCLKKHFKIVVLLFVTIPSICLAQKVGLVLSGGGAYGMAHIGVIKALEENGIPIDYITGTSAGAIVGSMYVSGFSPNQMEFIVNDESFSRMSAGIVENKYNYFF